MVDNGGFAAEPAAELRPLGCGELVAMGVGNDAGIEAHGSS